MTPGTQGELPETFGPTPETLDKLQPDEIEDLHDRQMIDSGGLRAADQIAQIHRAVTRASGVKSPTMGVGDVGQYELPDDIAKSFSDVYIPWRRGLGAASADFVVHVAVERRGMMGAGARRVVAKALMQYARMM